MSQSILAFTPSLTFQSTTFNVVDRNGQHWLQSSEIAQALGYDRSEYVSRIYRRNSDEFDSSMTENVKLTLSGNLMRTVRIFSLRGAYLIAMLAGTKKAKEFRKWVLDILEKEEKTSANYGNHERVNLASSAASEVSSQVGRAVFEAVMQAEDFDVKYRRWVFEFREDNNGKLTPSARLIQDGAMIVSMAELPNRITVGNGMYFTNQELSNLAAACTQRLKERIEYEESKKLQSISR